MDGYDTVTILVKLKIILEKVAGKFVHSIKSKKKYFFCCGDQNHAV